jgi:CarD family transcriptional regulator
MATTSRRNTLSARPKSAAKGSPPSRKAPTKPEKATARPKSAATKPAGRAATGKAKAPAKSTARASAKTPAKSGARPAARKAEATKSAPKPATAIKAKAKTSSASKKVASKPVTKPKTSAAKASPAKAPASKPAPTKAAARPAPAPAAKPAPAKAVVKAEAPPPPPPAQAAAPAAAPVKPEAPKPVVAAPAPAAVPAAPRPSIIIAAPTDTPSRGAGNPMSPRPPVGRPNVPPSFAVRSPGRPGFAEAQAGPPRPPAAKIELKAGDHVVYPTHGVGTVQGIETVEAAGMALQMVVVTFEENRMTLRVPVAKIATAGLRKLFTPKEFEQAIETLKGRARIKRTMWSRRAQEYEAKINSGDPIQIAEVVRDLQRNAGQPDQSFSERQIYEQALDRLAAEYAAIEKIDKAEASERLVAFAKSS